MARLRVLHTDRGQLRNTTTVGLPSLVGPPGARLWDVSTGKVAESDGGRWKESGVDVGPPWADSYRGITGPRQLVAAEYSPLIDASGDLNFELSLVPQGVANAFNVGALLSGQHGQQIELGTDGTNAKLFVLGSYQTAASIGFTRQGRLISVETWYRYTAGGAGIRARVQGCQISPDVTYTPTAALQAFSEAHFLTRDGIVATVGEVTVESLRRRTNDPRTHWIEFGIVGDSTLAENDVPAGTGPDQPAIGTLIYDQREAASRLGGYSVATPAHTIDQQRAAFLASPLAGNANVRWVGVGIGLNNVIAGHTVSSIIEGIRGLVSTIRDSIPGVTVFLAQMCPGGAYWAPHGVTAGATTWPAVNAAIAAGIAGAIPVTAHTPLLASQQAGFLDSDKDAGDGLHPITAGRVILAAAIRERVVQAGLL